MMKNEWVLTVAVIAGIIVFLLGVVVATWLVCGWFGQQHTEIDILKKEIEGRIK